MTLVVLLVLLQFFLGIMGDAAITRIRVLFLVPLDIFTVRRYTRGHH